MKERKIISASSKKKEEDKKKLEEEMSVSLDAQARLAEILNDSPRLVSLNGTEWEVRALRMGTQWLIAKKCVEIARNEGDSLGDIIRQFAINIPAVLDVLTLALLNDKNKIFIDGDDRKGFSDLYHATRQTLEWECDTTKFGEILLQTLQMLSVDFFMEALDVVDIFRAMTTNKKRARKEAIGQR